jgi:tetratricopeptide (TPR) repeat protein
MDMKKYILLLIGFLPFLLIFSQDNGEKVAEDFYAEKDYQNAAIAYEKLLEKGESADLYYNYANTLFKNDELGKAILFYERALKINPLHTDAKANLAFVNTKITDKIEALQPFFITEWFSFLGKMLTTNQWAFLSIALFFAATILALLFIFGTYRKLRKICFYTGIFAFFLSIFSLFFAFSQKKYTENNPFAIVLSGSVSVKSSPSVSGTELFILHEGTKIEVISKTQNWAEIRLSDGKTGWLQETVFEKI